MKVLHFITVVNKSSWVYRIHIHLNKLSDVESKIICFSNKTDDSLNIYPIESNIFKIIRKIQLFIERRKFSKIKFNLLFSSSLSSIKILKHKKVKELISWSDIINIHWINANFLSIYDIEKLLKVKNKKVIWRFYDANPFTGGCHFRLECTKYTSGCIQCPYVDNVSFPEKIYYEKYKIFNNKKMNILVASKYMKDSVLNSNIFKQSKIKIINNGIDSTFQYDKAQLRNKYGLKKEEKYILFGATNINLIYKGYQYLINTLKILEEEGISFQLLTFGDESKINIDVNYKITNFGFIQNRESLLELYALADIFIGPSIEEPFGNVFLESMSVGTPCVIFDETGAATDIIEHKVDGYIAKKKDIYDLANGIQFLLEHKEIMRLNCFKKIENTFLMSLITQKYFKYYKEV